MISFLLTEMELIPSRAWPSDWMGELFRDFMSQMFTFLSVEPVSATPLSGLNRTQLISAS